MMMIILLLMIIVLVIFPVALTEAASAAGIRPPSNPPRSVGSTSTTAATTTTAVATPTMATSPSSSSSSHSSSSTEEEDWNHVTWGSRLVDTPMRVVEGLRHRINLQGILGSSTRPTNSGQTGVYNGYDKIMGQPVFQVTTAWGSSYMNMEKLTADDMEREQLEEGKSKNVNANINSHTKVECIGGQTVAQSMVDSVTATAGRGSDGKSLGADDTSYRTISVYYLDESEAIAAHSEFKQMGGMADTDVRVTAVSLGKALRSASYLGRGLVTGQPIDYATGKVLSTKEGGSLRHKIMPPKKQLFYAAKCRGKERIGFFSESVDPVTGLSDRESMSDHAIASVLGNAALSYRNLSRRQTNKDRSKVRTYQPKNQYEAQYPHMDGYLGLPVFYLPGMVRQKSRIKALISGGARTEIPFFFNYEDLQTAWSEKTTTQAGGMTTADAKKKEGVLLPPATLPANTVEVYNLWDVLTSMEREHEKCGMQQQQHDAGRGGGFFSSAQPKQLLKSVLYPFTNRYRNVVGTSAQYDDTSSNVLDSIVFIPSSDATSYKESIRARGNGEARIRPMQTPMSVTRGGKGSLFGLI